MKGASLEGVQTVLVKFYFTNPKRIPAGIPQVERKPDSEMDKVHASQGGSDLGQVGRVREGRVDTGEPVYQNEARVGAELIRRALTNSGFRLQDAHWFTKKQEGKTTKFVVVLSFARGEPTELSRETTEALRDLADMSWFCHAWRNPNGVLTVNFVGLSPEKPVQVLTVRGGELALVI